MRSAHVTLLFSDGVARRLDAVCGTSVVDAAANAGLTLLTDCGNGRCGACTARLVSGAIELGDYDRAVLPDQDREGGAILTCMSRVTGPCVVELPYVSSEAIAEQPPPAVGHVVAIENVAAAIVRLEVSVDAALEFEPGQYVRIRPISSEIWRSYSMANASGSSRLVFFIRLVPGGVFSEWLSDSGKRGDELELSMPHGNFFLRDEERPRLFVAGGTGLAPFLSMLAAIAASLAKQRQPTTLLAGVRSFRHLFAVEELEQLRKRLPNLTLHFAAETDAAKRCHPGYATDLITKVGLDPATRVYLCGPPPMVDAGRNAAVAAGIARNDVLCERFA